MQVVALVDEVEVARYIAFKDKPETAEERKHKDVMKEQKGALIEALHQKCKCGPPLLSHTPCAPGGVPQEGRASVEVSCAVRRHMHECTIP